MCFVNGVSPCHRGCAGNKLHPKNLPHFSTHLPPSPFPHHNRAIVLLKALGNPHPAQTRDCQPRNCPHLRVPGPPSFVRKGSGLHPKIPGGSTRDQELLCPGTITSAHTLPKDHTRAESGV